MNHVIIIDDEVQSRNGIAEIFKNHSPGWEIDGLFEDGSLALDYLQQHPEVNLVVTDIRMPKFDGLELISRIRKNNGTIPIIIISGYSEFSYAKKAVISIIQKVCSFFTIITLLKKLKVPFCP